MLYSLWFVKSIWTLFFRSYPACRPHPSEERHCLSPQGWPKSRVKHEHSGLLFVLWFQSPSDLIALNISSLSVGAFFFINGFCGGNFPGKFSLGNFQGVWTRKFTHKCHSEDITMIFSHWFVFIDIWWGTSRSNNNKLHKYSSTIPSIHV